MKRKLGVVNLIRQLLLIDNPMSVENDINIDNVCDATLMQQIVDIINQVVGQEDESVQSKA